MSTMNEKPKFIMRDSRYKNNHVVEAVLPPMIKRFLSIRAVID